MNDDLISRGDALNCDRERCDNCHSECELTSDINHDAGAGAVIIFDKAAMPKQEWIPCSERLPRVFQKAVVCNIHGEMMIGGYTEFGWMFPCYFEKPIAWMPLPEPWKGTDDE